MPTSIYSAKLNVCSTGEFGRLGPKNSLYNKRNHQTELRYRWMLVRVKSRSFLLSGSCSKKEVRSSLCSFDAKLEEEDGAISHDDETALDLDQLSSNFYKKEHHSHGEAANKTSKSKKMHSDAKSSYTQSHYEQNEELNLLLHEPKDHQVLRQGKFSTTILINSLCTMQRIAILEEGKLVELLLEPVQSSVQCDDIYLGVVTQFVPHMGGAFIDIGVSRPSFMKTNGNRIPFIFPPFKLMSPKNDDMSSYRSSRCYKKGARVIVQVVKERSASKGPNLTAYPKLRSRFWILAACCGKIGVSKKISGVERTRLRVIAKALRPKGFGLTIRTASAGHSLQELQKDLESLLSMWENIIRHAKSACFSGADPFILQHALSQTLSVVQDYFNEEVLHLVVDSPSIYHEVTRYLAENAPILSNRVELYRERVPIFDAYNIEKDIDTIHDKNVPLVNGGSLVIEQTEALVTIDVNSGHGMFGRGTPQEKAALDVNLAAANQIARELRLRNIGGIIVVDFIDMNDDSCRRLVYEEVKKAVYRDRYVVEVGELSKHGLMEIIRNRVRPSVSFMISEPCAYCSTSGRVVALDYCLTKIELEIFRLLAAMNRKPLREGPSSWPKFILWVDQSMHDYLSSGNEAKLASLQNSLKVQILPKVNRDLPRASFEVKPFSDNDMDR